MGVERQRGTAGQVDQALDAAAQNGAAERHRLNHRLADCLVQGGDEDRASTPDQRRQFVVFDGDESHRALDAYSLGGGLEPYLTVGCDGAHEAEVRVWMTREIEAKRRQHERVILTRLDLG